MRDIYKNHMGKMLTACSFKILESAGDLILPFLMAKIIDNGILKKNIDYTYKIGILMIGISTIGYLCAISANYFSINAAESLGQEIRSKIFEKTQKFNFIQINKFTQASLITRLTNDITQIVSMTIMCMRMIMRGLATGIGSIVMAFIIDVKLAFVVLIIVILSIFFTYYYMEKSISIYEILQRKLDYLNKILRENLSGIRIIKALVKEGIEKEKFKKGNKELAEEAIKAQNIMASRLPFITLMLNLGILVVLYLGADRVETGNLKIGEIVAFVNYFNMLLFSMNAISFLFYLWSKTIISFKRVKDVLDEKEITSLSDDEIENHGKDNEEIELEFKNVNFSYEGNSRPILKNINFKILKNEKVGIIGGVGSGKTSIINLILKFYSNDSGTIIFEGKNLKNWNELELRKKIGVVMQKSFLFSQTISENIQWGKKDSNDEEIREALEIAQIDDYVYSLPEKDKTKVVKGGFNFSGGQKQRLSIARTIIKDANLLIFDDSFSALDFITEFNLKKALFEKKVNSTLIIISQRVSTIKQLEKIIVLDKGEVVGIGTHKDLIENCPVYIEICESQLVGIKGDRNGQ